MRPTDFRNIIFDLGGVILNIDHKRTIQAFQVLGAVDFEDSFSKLSQAGLFDRYERGELASDVFRDGIRRAFVQNLTNEQIDNAWNAMLLDLPHDRIDLLKTLGKEKRLALLSNTNEIHIQAFNRKLGQIHGLPDLSALFSKVFYSFELGMRKPELRIFQHVMEGMGFLPSETLFIDDSPQHIEGARKAGLHVYHLRVEQGETVLDLFC